MNKSSLQSKHIVALTFLELLIYYQLVDKSSEESCDLFLYGTHAMVLRVLQILSSEYWFSMAITV